uniref:Putative secreted peptide n=1 Tax=Anopheles braziliensis TaxID=58242 RepID=A0A2M3ZW80_9DIPT
MNFTFPPRFVLVSLFVCACLRERECKHVCHRAHRVRLSVVALRELDDRMQRSQQTHTHAHTSHMHFSVHRFCPSSKPPVQATRAVAFAVWPFLVH